MNTEDRKVIFENEFVRVYMNDENENFDIWNKVTKHWNAANCYFNECGVLIKY